MESKILLYSQLSPSEQAEVEAYVAQHPDCYPLLQEARAFGDVLREAQRLYADAPDDEALAYHLATRQLNHHPTPAGLEAAFNRIETRLQADPDLQARYDRLAQRMADLEAGHSALSHFEQVTGHRLPQEASSDRGQKPLLPPTTRTDRDPSQRSRRGIRQVGTVIGSALALYMALYAISFATTSPLDELAAFESNDFLGRGTTRGTANAVIVPAEKQYNQAVSLLKEARSSTLGLFPHYDKADLQTAGRLLEEVATSQEAEQVLQLESTFLLAKVHLAQHNVPAARKSLQQVVERNDWRQTDAQALLEAIP